MSHVESKRHDIQQTNRTTKMKQTVQLLHCYNVLQYDAVLSASIGHVVGYTSLIGQLILLVKPELVIVISLIIRS